MPFFQFIVRGHHIQNNCSCLVLVWPEVPLSFNLLNPKETERGSRHVECPMLLSYLFTVLKNTLENDAHFEKWHFLFSGYWSITVYGRKHCYRLYTKHFNEAVHWACAIQKIIDTKSPVETPTQLLIRDIEVGPHKKAHKHTRVAAKLPAITLTGHYLPPLCYRGNHTTTPGWESKVYSL